MIKKLPPKFRYRLPPGAFAAQPVINSIMGPNGSFVKYNTQTSTDFWEVNNKTEPQNKGYNFNPAMHLLWPIPNSEVVASEGAVQQNPGYF